jgi:hypothetical protein
MKSWRHPLAVFVLLSSATLEAGETRVPSETAKEVAAILEKFPSQTKLKDDVRIVNELMQAAQRPHTEKQKDAEAVVKQVGQLVPQLRKLLVIGANVCAYPGLLAHGEISYEPMIPRHHVNGNEKLKAPAATPAQPSLGYRLYVGYPTDEGIYDSDFDVFFDEKGVIQAIESIDWKS